jgi:hypothetical protein
MLDSNKMQVKEDKHEREDIEEEPLRESNVAERFGDEGAAAMTSSEG